MSQMRQDIRWHDEVCVVMNEDVGRPFTMYSFPVTDSVCAAVERKTGPADWLAGYVLHHNDFIVPQAVFSYRVDVSGHVDTWVDFQHIE